MSCCTVEKPQSSKYLIELEKEFDELNIVKKEMYQEVTIRDKANKKGYDWIVWVQEKVAYGHTNGCTHNSDSKLESMLKNIYQLLPLLRKVQKKDTSKQLSLFGEEINSHAEPMPQKPDHSEDWTKYFKEVERVNKINFEKKYNFLDFYNPVGRWWSYWEPDFLHLLPKNNHEVYELAKEYLSGDIKNPLMLGNKIFKDEFNYLGESEGLSDMELMERLHFQVDFSLFPYVSQKHLDIDDSYHVRETDSYIHHRVRVWRCEIEGKSNWDNHIYMKFDYNNARFLQWVRDFFNTPKIEPMSDEDILKANIDYFFNSMLGRETSFDYKENINSSKDWKDFKKKLLSFAKENNVDLHNGGGSGFSFDSLEGSYDLWGQGSIRITQEKHKRELMNRETKDIKTDEMSGRLIVYQLVGDDIYKMAYELFSESTSLLDFMVA